MPTADVFAVARASEAAEKCPPFFVIPSEARNLAFFSSAQTKERFLASLGMKKVNYLFRSLFSRWGVVLAKRIPWAEVPA
jgi:hypothetical protein